MHEIVLEKQPILSRILNKINNTSTCAQAYMLVGINPEDLEKNALLLSKVMICPHKYFMNCSLCNICARINSGNFGELKIINPVNGTINKEKIIKLRDSFQTQSIEGKKQVYIINNAETLNSSAANSLLKFLEEPESNTVAIFTTTNLNEVINTIVSRCQIIKLNNTNIKKDINFIETITNLDIEQINHVLNYLFVIENNIVRATALVKELYLDEFNSKELLKSSFLVILLAYKDALNYKTFQKMEYFNGETGIKNIANSHSTKILIKKIKFILENIHKLEYNVNVTLFVSNVLIGIGEITNGKGDRN